MKLKRFQFSLRTILGVMLALSLLLGLPRIRSIRQHLTAKQLARASIDIRVVKEAPKQPLLSRLLFGDNTYDHVFIIDIVESNASPSDLQLLQHFPSTLVFAVENTPHAEHALEVATRLPNIERLVVKDVAITEKGLQHLGQLHKLRQLNFWNIDHKDADFGVCGNLENLEQVRFAGPSIGDKEIQWLRNCPKLSDVRIDNTRISAAGLNQLGANIKLHRVSLQGVDIRNAPLPHFSTLPSLTWLSIDHSKIDRKSIDQLNGNLPLAAISISSDSLIDADADELMKTFHPRLHINQPSKLK